MFLKDEIKFMVKQMTETYSCSHTKLNFVLKIMTAESLKKMKKLGNQANTKRILTLSDMHKTWTLGFMDIRLLA